MKKLLLPLAVIVLLALATPAAFAEWEFGMSWTPQSQGNVGGGQQSKIDSLVGFHVGFGFLYILYASWDSIAMPDYMTFGMTSYTDAGGNWQGGYYAPGFLNLYDAGLRFVLGPIVLFAEGGVNNIWVYREGMQTGNLGANLRVGAGLKFNWWGINVSGTSVYPTFNDLKYTVGGLFNSSTRDKAMTSIIDGLVWSVGLTFYIGK